MKDSVGQGNYSGSIATTGSNTAYQQRHIYDMAGNVWEWTMQAYGEESREYRGGSYYNTGKIIPPGSPLDYYAPASARVACLPYVRAYYTDYSSDGKPVGFRVALYL